MMNTRIYFCALAAILTCSALGETAYAQSEDESIQPYWRQAPSRQLKAPITPSCPEYIQKGEWKYRSDEGIHEWAISLTPTPCGRYIDVSEIGLMFYEIVLKFGQSPYWHNNRGVINQLICHAKNAREKPEWNLEPFRPYVGSVITEQARCNPLTPNPDPDFQ
ncbi:DUF2599 domain-containing protein [Pseudomonas sp. GD03842]|uniref:DUF2599 domain-containing protein n=1 Tax=Pseudomonas sp. GD03842 TaxID=2975385 RepID=UPI0024481981|nr:DUF2599 domain-containing protein [Pseudomonas sp. GD03842]MDH0747894.1 DUF2599 domain-containing protein [Pseudomonas sp. GD03842]